MSYKLTKEEIKAEVLQIAAHFWGVENVEMLDPIAGLLLEALANEVYRVRQEIQVVEGRVLQRLAELLAPPEIYLPSPSFAVMHARSIEPVFKLSGSKVFSSTAAKAAPDKADGPSFLFMPAGDTWIFGAGIEIIVSPLGMYAVENFVRKERISETGANNVRENVVWLGIGADKELRSLKGMSFYFDWPGISDKAGLFEMLEETVWSAGGKELDVRSGILSEPGRGMERRAGFLDAIDQTRLDISGAVAKHFIHIVGDHPIGEASFCRYPPALAGEFPADHLDGMLVSDRLWIRIQFPPACSCHMLDSMLVSMNAFPVINMYIRKTEDQSNIIPIEVSDREAVLGIERVYTASGKVYREVNARHFSQDAADGTYTISNGILNRFDHRNARELIDYIFELFRDDFSAFSEFKASGLMSTYENIKGQFEKLERELSAYPAIEKPPPYYLLIHSNSSPERVIAEYWVTNHKEADAVRPGTVFKEVAGADCVPGEIVLLTRSTGGKPRPAAKDMLVNYRYWVSSGDRIVTAHDIESFVFKELGQAVQSVAVEGAAIISPYAGEGIVPCIDIVIKLSQQAGYDEAQLESLRSCLLAKILNRSIPFSRYRIHWKL